MYDLNDAQPQKAPAGELIPEIVVPAREVENGV